MKNPAPAILAFLLPSGLLYIAFLLLSPASFLVYLPSLAWLLLYPRVRPIPPLLFFLSFLLSPLVLALLHLSSWPAVVLYFSFLLYGLPFSAFSLLVVVLLPGQKNHQAQKPEE